MCSYQEPQKNASFVVELHIDRSHIDQNTMGRSCTSVLKNNSLNTQPSSQPAHDGKITPDQPRDYNRLIVELKSRGLHRRSDLDQPSFKVKPVWFDAQLFEVARKVYATHFMGVNFAHLSGLLLLVRVDSIYRTLDATSESSTVSKLFKRYYHTVKHVKLWYEGDIFEPGSPANRSLCLVRGMHNKVSSKLNSASGDCLASNPCKVLASNKTTPNSKNNNNYEDSIKYCQQSSTVTLTCPADKQDVTGVHLSEYDIMITQFAFVGFIVLHAKSMGLVTDFSRRDLEGFLHFWRVIGHYLGASDEFNLCAYDLDDVVGLCRAITQVEYKSSIVKNPIGSPQGIMSVNIVRSIKFIPMITVYGMIKHLYDILEHHSNEVESRKTSYSNLSYTLIKLVMTRILANRPMRSFNNGLIRLSLFLVGKIEHYNIRYLDWKFGQTLKV